jgi:hypothetical protein
MKAQGDFGDHITHAVVTTIRGAVIFCAVCGSILTPVAALAPLSPPRSLEIVALAANHPDDNQEDAPRSDPVPRPSEIVTASLSNGTYFVTMEPPNASWRSES